MSKILKLSGKMITVPIEKEEPVEEEKGLPNSATSRAHMHDFWDAVERIREATTDVEFRNAIKEVNIITGKLLIL